VTRNFFLRLQMQGFRDCDQIFDRKSPHSIHLNTRASNWCQERWKTSPKHEVYTKVQKDEFCVPYPTGHYATPPHPNCVEGMGGVGELLPHKKKVCWGQQIPLSWPSSGGGRVFRILPFSRENHTNFTHCDLISKNFARFAREQWNTMENHH